MNNMYPHNRLQQHLYKRFNRFLLVLTFSILGLVISMVMTGPEKMFAQSANPANYTNFPNPPQVVYTNANCSGATECPNTIWWDCNINFANPSNSGGTGPYTCVHVGSGALFITANLTTATGPTRKRITFTGIGQASYWNGSAWAVASIQFAAVNPYCTIGTGTTPIVSNVDVKSGGSGPYDFSEYCLSSTFASNTVVQSSNIQDFENSGLTIKSPSPYVQGRPIKFNVNWNTAYDVWRVELYKNPTSPQYHESIGGGNFNLGRTNNFDFTTSYTNSGTYLPKVLLGNASCTGASSTGASLTGSGCLYTIATLTGSIRILSTDELLSAGSGTTAFSWVGGQTAQTYYQTGSVLVPTAQDDEPDTIFSWVAGTGSIYYQEDTVTETGSTGMRVIGPQGIFNASLFNFSGFGNTGNAFLDAAQSLLLIVVYAAIWVGQFLLNLLQISSFFDFFLTSVHAPAGTVATVPTHLFGFPIHALQGITYTIEYAPNSGNYQNVTRLIQISTVFSVIIWIINHFIFFRKKR